MAARRASGLNVGRTSLLVPELDRPSAAAGGDGAGGGKVLVLRAG